jgi:hypothetical protein
LPTPLAAIAVLLAPASRAHSALYDEAEYGLLMNAFSREILVEAPDGLDQDVDVVVVVVDVDPSFLIQHECLALPFPLAISLVCA